MILAILLLIAGLTISAVAIYYSVLGLAAIFAASVPIYIMGTTLELSKLIAASWLKANWTRASGFIKWYMLGAVAILMLITSMGIFGFLSKTSLDHGVASSENQIQIAELDRQIEIEKLAITDATRVINQLDQAVQSLTDSQNISGRAGAVSIRKQQAAERRSLNNIIQTANTRISQLEQQKLPLIQSRLNIEAEVGPIKYLAQLIYGANPSKDILEKSVTWVIVLLVVVFDPLAVVMLLAAQTTFAWYRSDRQAESIAPAVYAEPKENTEETPINNPNKETLYANVNPNDNIVHDDTTDDDRFNDISSKIVKDYISDELREQAQGLPYTESGLELELQYTASEPANTNTDETSTLAETCSNTNSDLSAELQIAAVDAAPIEDENTKAEAGAEPVEVIEDARLLQLVDYNQPSTVDDTKLTSDSTHVSVDEPRFQILPELVEESSKKKIHDQAARTSTSNNQEITYVQNSEQNQNSIWNQIRSRVSGEFKPKDFLIVVYSQTGFDDFQYDATEEPELDKFIKDIKSGKHSFGDYPQDQLTYFANRIYEFRQN